MVARGSGKIIFVASMLSFQGGVTVPGYAASKGGIAQLTKALANEWASPWRECERRCTGLHRNRQHAGTPGRRDARLRRSSSGSPRVGGVSRKTSPARSSSSRRPHPTTFTASCFPSTEAGWRDERRRRETRRADGSCRCSPRATPTRPNRRVAALLEGGLSVVEITFRTDAAAEAIRRASVIDGLLVGAGTVLSPEQLARATTPVRASPSRQGRTTRSSRPR